MTSERVQNVLRKIAGSMEPGLMAAAGAATFGIPGGIVDYIQSGSDPELKKSKSNASPKLLLKV